MLAQVYVVALTLAFAQFAFAATCSRKYTVKKGDICDKISQEQHVSTYQLAANNPNIVDRGCTNLLVGESLCLGTTNEDCSTTHTVQAGDTCDKIATANGLNMTILHMNNPQLDQACDIYEGEVLCTSKRVQVPPVPSGGVPKSMPGPKPTQPPPSPTRTSSSHSFPGVTIISFPSSGASTMSSSREVIEHAINRPSTEHASPPEPTDSDLVFCDEL